MIRSTLIAFVVLAASAAGTTAQGTEEPTTRIVAMGQERPAGVGQRAVLRVVVRDERWPVTRLFVAFGDGTSTTVVRGCDEARRAGRPAVFRVRHRYRAAGTVTVRARATADQCRSDDSQARRSAPRSIRVKNHPARVRVPDLVGRRMSSAECALAARGLRWRYPGLATPRWRPGSSCSPNESVQPDPRIVSQSVATGRSIAPGSVVVIDHDCRGNCG